MKLPLLATTAHVFSSFLHLLLDNKEPSGGVESIVKKKRTNKPQTKSQIQKQKLYFRACCQSRRLFVYTANLVLPVSDYRAGSSSHIFFSRVWIQSEVAQSPRWQDPFLFFLPGGVWMFGLAFFKNSMHRQKLAGAHIWLTRTHPARFLSHTQRLKLVSLVAEPQKCGIGGVAWLCFGVIQEPGKTSMHFSYRLLWCQC